MFAVDPTVEVAREAAEWGADLLVVHHPLFLKPVHGFAATTPKGRTLRTLAAAGCALLTAHTNADRAVGGRLGGAGDGARADRPRARSGRRPTGRSTRSTCSCRSRDADRVRAALAGAGAGRIGDYDARSFTTPGEGRFRPLDRRRAGDRRGRRPEVVAEVRVEAVLPRGPSYARWSPRCWPPTPTRSRPTTWSSSPTRGPRPTGAGRIGDGRRRRRSARSPRRVGRALPATAHGVRVAGDPDRVVRRVAVCGGAGDFLLDEVLRSDADVYVTSDLRHHPAAEFLEQDGPGAGRRGALGGRVDLAAGGAGAAGRALGDTVETRVSTLCTDPWTLPPLNSAAPTEEPPLKADPPPN